MIRHILAAAAAPSNTEDANVKSETLNTEGGKASSPRPAQA
jgi:hypothetical protein